METLKKYGPSERRKETSLNTFSTLPLDILFEIFVRLGPAELLHMARANKAFRNILMLHQSAFVWKAVLDAVGDDYPPRPQEMSEPAWVNLIWGGPWCSACLYIAYNIS
ncbi:hypothetical protein K488DRAFT_48369 [Vararia minispora EC-137]|uniref:Uncharacterized protein n=1 Tax=Vararia minispora EC-137 TaxID=1314806 RepID=A0ACB8QN98_9AGAM|nr:hypothetical protein K488DRAFT_48369 [Vararia minispora EC-137]